MFNCLCNHCGNYTKHTTISSPHQTQQNQTFSLSAFKQKSTLYAGKLPNLYNIENEQIQNASNREHQLAKKLISMLFKLSVNQYHKQHLNYETPSIHQ